MARLPQTTSCRAVCIPSPADTFTIANARSRAAAGPKPILRAISAPGGCTATIPVAVAPAVSESVHCTHTCSLAAGVAGTAHARAACADGPATGTRGACHSASDLQPTTSCPPSTFAVPNPRKSIWWTTTHIAHLSPCTARVAGPAHSCTTRADGATAAHGILGLYSRSRPPSASPAHRRRRCTQREWSGAFCATGAFADIAHADGEWDRELEHRSDVPRGGERDRTAAAPNAGTCGAGAGPAAARRDERACEQPDARGIGVADQTAAAFASVGGWCKRVGGSKQQYARKRGCKGGRKQAFDTRRVNGRAVFG